MPDLRGITAADVVKSTRASADLGREIFRDERLLDGRVWMVRVARCFALEAGRAAVVDQMHLAFATIGLGLRSLNTRTK